MTDLSVDALRQGGLFDVPVNEAAERLGMSAGTLKRACRKLGLPRWPFRVRKSLRAVIARTEEFLEDDNTGKKQAILESLRAQLEDVKGRGGAMDCGTRKYRQTVFKLNHCIAKQPTERCGRLRISRAAAGQLLREEEQQQTAPPPAHMAGSDDDAASPLLAPCWLGEGEGEVSSRRPPGPTHAAGGQWPGPLHLPGVAEVPGFPDIPTASGWQVACLHDWQPRQAPEPQPRAASLSALPQQPWVARDLWADRLPGARSLSLPPLPLLPPLPAPRLAGQLPPLPPLLPPLPPLPAPRLAGQPLPRAREAALPSWRPPPLECFGGETRQPLSPCGTEGSLQSDACAYRCPQPAAHPHGWEAPPPTALGCSDGFACSAWEPHQQQPLLPQAQLPGSPPGMHRASSEELLSGLAESLGLL